MSESVLLTKIQQHLNRPDQNLEALFCETLLWGRAQGPAFTRQVTLAPGQTVSLEIRPLAQLSGLPVFRVDWPSEKPPTLLQRRSVHRALVNSYAEHLLVYITRDGQQAAFVWARRRSGGKIELRTLPYTVGSPARTTIEQLGKLAFSLEELGLSGDPGRSAVTAKLDAAFDVEAVTRRFFRDYRILFEQAEASIDLPWSAEQKRLYTQRFFNRLLFLVFLERKGWLTFHGRKDYLRALFEDYLRNDPDKRRSANFHRKRLNALFFMGLNNPYGRDLLQNDPQYADLRDLIGEVPYLNGGLFEREADDETFFFPDDLLARILADLLYRYNFTVTESTPLDVEVAVDPEMLGKIFEELVTGRHESGSYYTPKPVVQFMCREALKSYLETALPAENAAAIARFVDENDGAALRDPEAALAALKQVKVCDPACGSGAYLLGMLHELLEKREALFAARRLDAQTLYQRKLEIIQNNLYGVDLDPFAVNIARLRLWLSLIVDYEGYPPPPLPNLDFKIEAGDSLTAPDPSGGLQPDLFRYGQVQEFLRLKNAYMSAHAGPEEKKQLLAQIKDLKAQIKTWAHGQVKDSSYENAFDWQVEFAEVFAPSLTPGPLSSPKGAPTGREETAFPPGPSPKEGLPSPAGGRAGEQGKGGFDIVLANPPYVRQELIKDLKPALKRVYGPLFTGTADLYVYFYLRAHQLLKPGGTACFISSNKWLRAGYGETLRQHLLDEQAFRLVVDFGELPVFQTAATFPAIFLWQKRPRWSASPAGRGDRGEGIPTTWAVVKDLQACYEEGITEHVARIAQRVPAEQFGKGKPRLAAAHTADLRRRMEARGIPLGEYAKGKIYFGIKTGYNEAFLLDEAARQRLIAQDPRSAEIIKPLLVGDDVRHYEIHYRGRYLIWTYIGVPIERYPAVFAHLQQYQPQLEKRWDKGNHWWELRACDYYAAFEQPKIIYPDIGKEPRFYLDEAGYFSNNTSYFIGLNDWFLLAILNSQLAFDFMKSTASVLGDENKGGRVRFFGQFAETLPIPDASSDERQALARLARQAQALHMQRRARVERFLREIGLDPARSTSRNPLEQPWLLTPEELARRVAQVSNLRQGQAESSSYRAVREETLVLTEQIEKVEKEIDMRVRALYGL